MEQENNIFNEWIDVYNLPSDSITEDITVVNVDTRDFCLICDDKPVTRDFYGEESGNSKQKFYAYDLLTDEQCKPEFLIDRKDIIEWLKNIENITRPSYFSADSDVKHDWRIFNFNIDYKRINGWDLKYLRIFKHHSIPDKFIVCTDCLVALKYGQLTEETVKKS